MQSVRCRLPPRNIAPKRTSSITAESTTARCKSEPTILGALVHLSICSNMIASLRDIQRRGLPRFSRGSSSTLLHKSRIQPSPDRMRPPRAANVAQKSTADSWSFHSTNQTPSTCRHSLGTVAHVQALSVHAGVQCCAVPPCRTCEAAAPVEKRFRSRELPPAREAHAVGYARRLAAAFPKARREVGCQRRSRGRQSRRSSGADRGGAHGRKV